MVGIGQWAPGTSVLEEIVDIFHNYNSDYPFKSVFFKQVHYLDINP